jgi:hypothetical protein
MQRFWPIPLGVVMLAAWRHESLPAPASPRSAAPAKGSADADLQVMLSELASSKACGLIRGEFHALRATDRPDVVVGVLWVRECEITNVGAHLTFHVGGNGWLWVDQTKKKGGGTFVVHQYIRFGIDATLQGALDIGYDRHTHVVSLWFTPDRPPDVAFKMMGDVDVDREGVWSSIVGAIGTALGSSPEAAAQSKVKAQGTEALEAQLADGIAVAVNLCTGLSLVQLGRPAKAEMGAAKAGEPRRVPVEIHPGGAMLVGPSLAGSGMTIRAHASEGAVRLSLVCAEDAETIAAEFLAGRIMPTVPVLGTVDVRAEARLRIKPAKCPVVVVVSPLDNAPARFDWQRPTAEVARSTGGPLIKCQSKP